MGRWGVKRSLTYSCRVKDPVGQGLTTHPYRVLQQKRSTLRQVRGVTFGERKPRRSGRDGSDHYEPVENQAGTQKTDISVRTNLLMRTQGIV
jgi:hypothetical protein